MSSNDLENKLEAIKKLIGKIDLTRCSPVPWGTRSYNCPIGDTGDVYGCTDLFDNTGETILTKASRKAQSLQGWEESDQMHLQ